MLNFTAQDLFGSAIALLLFPLVSVFPGYVLGWAFNLFLFNSRTWIARLAISLVLSAAVLPVLAFLVLRFLPPAFAMLPLFLCAVLCGAGELNRYNRSRHSPASGIDPQSRLYRRIGILFGVIWVVFSLLLLVDFQFGRQLYFANVAYDYTTRIAVINAISRTGVPPINPSYFPGRPEKLTFLYYYWYISPSLIDQIGGTLVNSRQAMLAGTIWTGLALMAGIALYLRLRNRRPHHPWIAPLIGIQLLLVSGVDVVPVLAIEARARYLLGHMLLSGAVEGWNMPVMSWLNAITWVPNHVLAAVQCFAALLLVLSVIDGSPGQRWIAGILAGLAFASAFGSSIWVMLVFAVAWILWGLILLLTRKNQSLVWVMVLAGLVGMGLSLPYILDLLHSGGVSGGGLPVALFVRPFMLNSLLLPASLQPVANLFLLPLNYLMELGFFFIVGLFWLQHRRRYADPDSPFPRFEIILLGTVAVLLSFVYSTLITINDLGIRGWLLGQVVLLVWASDILQDWLGKLPPWPQNIFRRVAGQPSIGRAVLALLVLGILTTCLEAFSTRMWSMLVDWDVAGFPNNLSPDTHFGSRMYDARLAYAFIDSHLPQDIVVQYNPDIYLDRPSGLYGERQVAISDRTMYGVPLNTFLAIQKDLAQIFEHDATWEEIDRKCSQYSIDVLVVYDLDPLWTRLPGLETQRKPLYQNDRYVVLACGAFAGR